MPTDHRERLARIRRFDQLVAYLRDELGWPIESDDFEELIFEYTPEELGIDAKNAAKIQEIKRLRPLTPGQPWGIFFVKFEPKRLPVVALRRILGQVALKKRASANRSERQAWAADDLLFVSNYGEGEERRIAFAHFSKPQDGYDLPTLKVLGWDNLDTPLHLDAVARELTDHLAWPDDEDDADAWRERWRGAFTLGHREVITTSKQLSERLAELARAIRDRITTALAIETEAGPLTTLMKAFQTTLVHDLDEAAFADMYAQTIAYGLLSARITDPSKRTADDFAAHMRTNPFLRELMETFLRVGGRRGKAGGPGIDFDELGVSEVVELLDQANMEAVVRDFGDRNPQEDPVIHFYEHFLAAYDKKQKVSRGVFYTPRPVVLYIVRSVDELLRTEFGLEDGLADITTWGEMAKRHKDLKIPEGTSPDQPFVQILDPATGTGTFLVEAIDLIYRAMVEKWKAKGHGEKKIQALWNEYVPKHLLPRLYGYELLMAPYAIAHLKVGLKLYETGYRFQSDERARIYLTNSLEPPGDGQLTLDFLPALAHEAEAVNEIKRKQRFTVVIGNPPYSRATANDSKNAQDLVAPYKDLVRDERNIQPLSDDYIKFTAFSQHVLSRAGAGVFGMVTNNTYLSGRIHRGMRKLLVKDNVLVRVIDLHGSQRVASPGAQGLRDENVFDILQGVSITLTARPFGQKVCEYSELIGRREEKFERLCRAALEFIETSPAPPYHLLVPVSGVGPEYETWPSLAELAGFYSVSGKPGDDSLLVAFGPAEVLPKLRRFGDDLARGESVKLTEAGRKLAALAPGCFEEDRILRYAYRPFDDRYSYYDTRIWTRAVERLQQHIDGSPMLLTTKIVKDRAFAHVFVTRQFPDVIFLSNTSSVNCYGFPLHGSRSADRLIQESPRNLNPERITQHLHLDPSEDALLHYIYAALYSPTYRKAYQEPLRLDFPHIPVPHSAVLFQSLAAVGEELIKLHLMESRKLGEFITTYTGPKSPEVGRVGWSDGTVWLDAGKTSASKGHRATKPGTIGFQGVPEEVWDFHIGGYQVCYKWLKDRKGRTLSDEDIAHYQKIVVALKETIRIMAEIDEVIEAHGGWPGAFQTESAADTDAVGTTKVVPFRRRTVDPKPKEKYKTCVPLVPLKAAAGAFSDPQHIDADDFEWVEVGSRHGLRPGMFVAQVVGKSMEPAIPDGAYCLFRAPVQGTRQGKTVLVQLRDGTDPETGERYTVKRYKSQKAKKDDSWRHETITLEPRNPDFEPIVLTGADEGELQVIAELVEVLSFEALGEEG